MTRQRLLLLLAHPIGDLERWEPRLLERALRRTAVTTPSALGDQGRGLYLDEPPFIVDGSRPPLPADRWSIKVPIAAADSEDFIRAGAQALASILPNVTVLTLPDQDHSAFWTAPEPVAGQARAFLLG